MVLSTEGQLTVSERPGTKFITMSLIQTETKKNYCRQSCETVMYLVYQLRLRPSGVHIKRRLKTHT
jgi:hypothetical protein